MFNPAGMIYQQVDKRILQGKAISEKQNKKPKAKGILARSNSKQAMSEKQDYNDPLDFVIDAVITLRKEKESMLSEFGKDSNHYTMREVNPDAFDNSPPSNPKKDLDGQRLFDRLNREEKMYGRFKKKNEREA